MQNKPHDDTISAVFECAVDDAPMVKLPVYASRVQAGYPSPAEDYIERRLDLNDYVLKDRAATFFVRTAGDSMVNAGIQPDDLLVVDRSLQPRSGHIVIAVLNGELTVKRLLIEAGKPILKPENSSYPKFTFSSFDELVILGVVTNVVHSTL